MDTALARLQRPRIDIRSPEHTSYATLVTEAGAERNGWAVGCANVDSFAERSGPGGAGSNQARGALFTLTDRLALGACVRAVESGRVAVGFRPRPARPLIASAPEVHFAS